MASLKTVPVLLLLAIGLSQNHVAGEITDARLVNGTLPLEGTVELLVSGIWHRACGVNLGVNDGVVICRHLNFTGLNRVFQTTPYPTPSTATALLILDCVNIDSALGSCMHSEIQCSGHGGIKCHDQSYVGCFADKTGDRILAGDSFSSNTMTIADCVSYCDQSTTADYVFAGVEFGIECYCGTADDSYTRHGQVGDAHCQFACGGSDKDSCGGQEYMAVFRISMMTTPQQVTTTVLTSTVNQGRGTSDQQTMHTQGTMTQGPGGGEGVTDNIPAGGSNLAVYAGAGGGAFVIIIIIVVVIVIVVCFVGRSRHSEKPRENQLVSETASFPVLGHGGGGGDGGRGGDSYNDFDNLYHDVNFDGEQTISSGVQSYSEVNHDNHGAASIYQNQAMEMEAIQNRDSIAANGHAVVAPRPDHPAAPAGGGEPGQPSHPYANTDSGVVNDFAALYATPDKSNGKGVVEANDGVVGDFAALYATPDKPGTMSGFTVEGQGGGQEGVQGVTPSDLLPDGDEVYTEVDHKVDFASMYSQVDKSKTEPSMEGVDVGNMDEGLYATSMDDRPTVNDDGQYGTRMVENELYTL